MSTTQNILKYTGLDYTTILQQITNALKANPRFDNFRESAIAQTINEIFAGTADLINYYVQRQAEESFFETSQRDSSAILSSRNLAYDVTRPIPATTTIKIVIKGDMRSLIQAGRKLQIPVFSKFTYNNSNFILKKGFTYTFTDVDAQDAIDDTENYEKTITEDDDGDEIILIQGTLKSKTILGSTNPQVGQIFQTYRIPDVTFSNYYGSADLADYPTTRVWVGETEYTIDRRSLINNTVLHSMLAGETIKCALIRTAVDGDIELKFGTATIAALGAQVDTGSPETTFDDIIIQYLSTLGSKSNQTGVIDEIVTYSNQIKIGAFDITSKTQLLFASNVIGGSDIETQEAIKINAPAIFYSLDRAVNITDHINILKTITSPIRIKNAIAWGEQEEAKARNVSAMVELFNVGFFTCVGTLYNIEGDITTDTYSVRTNYNRLDESVLDDPFDEDALSSQYYYNIFVKNMVARQLREQSISTHFWEINNYVPVASDKNYEWFASNYPSDIVINYTYASDKYLPGTTAITSITINMSSITSMDDIATAMQTAFQAKLDERTLTVEGIETNNNHGQTQFPGITVTWNSETRTFKITNAVEDACCLYSIDPTSNQAVVDLGMHDATDDLDPAIADKIYINLNGNYLSSKIEEVLSFIAEKGMITTRYVYVSPLIQSFRAKGTVYVNQLFSLDDLRKQANNQTYKFLDDNADFNVPVYKSNIIEIIEKFNGIQHVDITFEPDIPLPIVDDAEISYRTTFYFPVPGKYDTVDKYGDYASLIYDDVYAILLSYFPPVEENPTSQETYWRAYIEASRLLTPDEIQDDQTENDTKKFITERYFLTTIVNEIYTKLKDDIGTSRETTFPDTTDFVTMISDIHKDLSWIIRSNMIDSHGNIAPEYHLSTNVFGVNVKTLERGGFSMGNEIAKINFDAVSVELEPYEPYLSYEYK